MDMINENRESENMRLERTTFETSRAGEYFDSRQLSALTGVPPTQFASVILKESNDIALDACETVGVAPEVVGEVPDSNTGVLKGIPAPFGGAV
jgi:hypothetical protein